MEVDQLINSMEKIYKKLLFNQKIQAFVNLKENMKLKRDTVNELVEIINSDKIGEITKSLLQTLQIIRNDFQELSENMDDKFMIFIIGNGNVGKSTLLNSLIGYKVADTNFLPNTWKIDVYYPSLNDNTVYIKYLDGEEKKFNLNEAKRIVTEEENKCKESKKVFNAYLNKELDKLTTKDQREELRLYLAKKYLYKSKITEVRWPVKNNWLLEKCQLVDTPGLNQNLHDLKQLGSINDYYHKADGVIWLIDGQTISAKNTEFLYKELDDVLKTVGGIRDNIICVINRMDLVRISGGENSASEVQKQVYNLFKNKFKSIVAISAKDAFQGIISSDNELIEKSQLESLQSVIKDIFISKSDKIKNSSKVQGYNKLLNDSIILLNEYIDKLDYYESLYQDKNNEILNYKDKLKNQMGQSVKEFFDNYLSAVYKRVSTNIYELSKGNGEEYVKSNMYKLEVLDEDLKRLTEGIKTQLQNSKYIWQKICIISEYKYIDILDKLTNKDISLCNNFEFKDLSKLSYFKPYLENDIFGVIGNIIGKSIFLFRSGSLQRKICKSIKDECERIQNDLLNQIDITIEDIHKMCIDKMNSSIKTTICEYKDLSRVKSICDKYVTKLLMEKYEVSLINMLI